MANTSTRQLGLLNSQHQTMNHDAATYFNALVSEIFAQTGIVIVPTEGTRTYARQKELYDGYINGRIDPSTGQRYNAAWSPDSPFAYHLSGRAVDVGSGVGYVSTPAAKAWRSRMKRYGFREEIRNEPWHFEWRSEWVDPLTREAVENPVPAEPELDLEPMIVVELTQTTASFNRGDKFALSIGRVARVSKKTVELFGYKDKVVSMNKSDFRDLIGQLNISEAAVRATK